MQPVTVQNANGEKMKKKKKKKNQIMTRTMLWLNSLINFVPHFSMNLHIHFVKEHKTAALVQN